MKLAFDLCRFKVGYKDRNYGDIGDEVTFMVYIRNYQEEKGANLCLYAGPIYQLSEQKIPRSPRALSLWMKI
jgi:hypothetical protein